jgi:hypothetical protein
MRIIESFTVYRCTQCETFHFSNMDWESVFDSHSRFHDSHGIITRYALNEKMDIGMFVATALFLGAWVAYVIFRVVKFWPNKEEWGFPISVTIGLWFSAIWLVFVHDKTFGRSPWRKERPRSGARLLSKTNLRK